ncbi:MAG: 50S ribosomal protein L5 [Candidatus Pacebacteria bacterium]|nr:50S ribosomal protein L5 [Candidatus Paceibacterota bacterium]
MQRLTDKYNTEVVPGMMNKFGYKSKMAVPRIEKVVVNTGYGREVAGKSNEEQKKIADFICGELALICGQKAVKTYAKKAISSFKIREGMAIGAKVTLRGKKMRDFLERLIHLSLPRMRDFKGIPVNSVDKQGNLTIAIKEHIVFPEILPEKAKNIFGLEITVVTTAKKKEEALEFFRLLGFPMQTE